MSKEILEAVKDLGTEVKGQVDTVKTEVKSIKDAAEVATTEVKSLITVVKDESEKKYQELKAEFDDMKKKGGRIGGMGSAKSFSNELAEKIIENKDKLGKKSMFQFEMDTKAVGNIGSSASLTGTYLVPAETVPGIVAKQFEETHLRNLLPTGQTSSNVIRHLRDNGGEGGPAMVAEAATKPQMDRDLSIEDANVRKIATYMRVPEEMIEDIPYLTSFLSSIGTEEVLKVEDNQILYGDGTGQNLSGLVTNSTAFAAGTGNVIDAPNRYDVLRAARLQMRKLFRKPSFYLVSPLDYFIMTSTKDSTDNYILMGGGNGMLPSFDGVPVIETTGMTDGDFLAVDRLAAQIFFRSNINVRFYDQDQDNAIKNMVTIVIEERLALPIYYTSGLVKGTFATAITDLTS